MRREYYSEVRCNYIYENYWYVDAWKTNKDNEEGRVIAVIHNPDGDVYYIEPEAEISRLAQYVINTKIDELRSNK